jgi:hypothetical protein
MVYNNKTIQKTAQVCEEYLKLDAKLLITVAELIGNVIYGIGRQIDGFANLHEKCKISRF